nr:MAG TPA: hypothetical protein [Caudoviricetes sp.]
MFISIIHYYIINISIHNKFIINRLKLYIII